MLFKDNIIIINNKTTNNNNNKKWLQSNSLHTEKRLILEEVVSGEKKSIFDLYARNTCLELTCSYATFFYSGIRKFRKQKASLSLRLTQMYRGWDPFPYVDCSYSFVVLDLLILLLIFFFTFPPFVSFLFTQFLTVVRNPLTTLIILSTFSFVRRERADDS